MRIMAGDYHAQQQQIVRIDREFEGGISIAAERMVLSKLERELKKADSVMMSDYNQGLFTSNVIRQATALCRNCGVQVVSRFRLASFRGVTTATPNEIEASEAAGINLEGRIPS